MLFRKDKYGRKRPGPLFWIMVAGIILPLILRFSISAFRVVTSGPKMVPPATTSASSPEARIPKRFYPSFGTVYTPGIYFAEEKGKKIFQLELFQPPHPRPSDWNLVPKTHPDGSKHFVPPEEVQDWLVYDFLESLNEGQKAIHFRELRTEENLRKYLSDKVLEVFLKADVLCAVSKGEGENMLWVHYCPSKTECVVGYRFFVQGERTCYDREGNVVKVVQDNPSFIYVRVIFEDGRWKWGETVQESKSERTQ